MGSILGIGSSTNTNPILELRNLQQRISTSAALSRNDLATRTRLTAERNGLNERSSLFSSLKTEIQKLNTLANGLNTASLIEKSGGTKLAQVTSSNTSVISAKVSGDVAGGTFGINVSRLASAASIGGGSITDIFRSRQLSDVLAVRNANYQQSQSATSASLQSGSVLDIYRSRDLGDLNSIQNANVVQTQTALAASLQGAAIEDIFTSEELSIAAEVKSSTSAGMDQIGVAASLTGKSLGTVDAVEVLGDTFNVASAGKDSGTNKSFVQLASASTLQTGDSVRLSGNLKQLKDADGRQVNGDVFVRAKDSSGTKYELYLTKEDAQSGTNALVFGTDNNTSGVSIQHVISPATQKITGSTTLAVLDSKSNQTYDFSVNGTSFQFDANTTIDTVVSQINQSASLDVTASFDASSGKFSLVANQIGAGSIVVGGGLETALGLKGNGITSVAGADELVEGSYINLQFAANGTNGRISLGTGDKVRLTGTLTGLQDASGNSVTGDTFFVGSHAGSDQDFALFLTEQDAQNGTNALSFDGNKNLTGVSVQKVLVDERTDQVTASTTLGQLDNLNSFTFSVNGTDFAFNQNTTLADVVSQINQSGTANVTATFDETSGAISLVSNEAAAGDVVATGDLATRLGLTGAGVTAVSGRDAVEGGNFLELSAPSGGSLATGDKVQLNGSIAGLQDANGNAVSGDTFFLRARGGSDQEFALFLTAEDAQNNTNAVQFSAGTNLSNVSVQKVLEEARIDPVTTSTTLGSLDNLSSFSFSVNGAGFNFDANTTIGDVIDQINQSADANVTASFNSGFFRDFRGDFH